MKSWSPERTRLALAEALGETLYDEPPPSPGEIAALVARSHVPTARRFLADRLTAGDLPDPELVLALLQLLGVGAEEPRLVALALDVSRRPSDRAVAFGALPDAAQAEVSATLGTPALLDLLDGPTRDLLTDAAPDPEVAELFADRIRLAPGTDRALVFERLEAMRREEGVDASLWEPLLRDPSLASLHETCLAAIVDEGAPESVPLLEALRDGEGASEKRGPLQKAILRIRSQPAREAPPAQGRAYLTGSDGSGAFVALFALERPGDRADIVNLCLLTRGEVRDGLVLPREPAAGVDAIVRRFVESAPGVIELPPERAAAIVRWAVARHPGDLPVPDDARAGLKELERIREVPLPEVAPDPVVDVDRLRRALDQPGYQTWFFEPADFAAVGVKAPKRATPRWLTSAARALAGDPAFRDRLLWMARYTAHQELARGDRETAALFRAAAREVEERFESAALTRLLLERSPADLPLAPEPELEERSYGDPYFRESLRRDVFAGLERPVGRDLARLDLTEAADVLLETAFDALPSEKRPGRPARLKVAAGVAELFAEQLCEGADRTDDFGPRFEALLGTLVAGKRQKGGVATEVLSGLLGFIEEVCDGCPVRCFEHPAEEMEEAFRSEEHPSTSRPRPRRRGRRR